MPVPDPQAGQAFLWLISCFLFLTIALGGGCLMAYTLLPYSPAWLPYVGIFFVCLPWLFWILTFLYRIVSRAFGFRMVIGGGGGGGGGNQAKRTGGDVEPAEGVEEPADIVEAADGGGLESNMDNAGKRSSTSSSSSGRSHESELPLTISMGA